MEVDTKYASILIFLLGVLSCTALQVASTAQNNCSTLCQGNKCSATQISNFCYVHFEGVKQTWSENAKLCQQQNMTMVNLQNDEEASVIVALGKIVGSHNAWLGGTAVDLREWKYVNDHTLTIAEFKLDYAPSFHKCGTVTHTFEKGNHYYELGLEPCYLEFRFICRSEGNIDPIANRKNWFAARKICKDTGGDLLYIKKGETTSKLLKSIDGVLQSVKAVFFIGLRHEKWQWQDGSEVEISDWNSIELNVSTVLHKKCLMLEDGKLSGTGCDWRTGVLCQKEYAPIDSTSQQQQLTSYAATSVFTANEKVSTETPSPASRVEKNMEPSYFRGLLSFGGSMLLLAITVPSIVCWMRRQREEAKKQERDENIYCEVNLESQVGSNQNKMHFDTPNVTMDSYHKNIIEGPSMSTRIPFSNTHVDDVVIMDNCLYGTSEETPVEGQRSNTSTPGPLDSRMSVLSLD